MLAYLFSALFSLSVAYAHEVPSSKEQPEEPDPKPAHYKRIMVLGNYHSSSILDVVPTVSTLEGENLVRKRTTSLGETLKNEVGVNSSSYGPTASRPVIRGLDGDRIRILQNGIGVLDASGASQDHAVPLDPLSAESIEIVRGPINLLYGSSAIGGVVNITNARIHDTFEEGFFGAVDAQGATVNSGRSTGAKVDYGVKNWMFHADGSYNKTLDMKVPGYVRSEALRKSSPTSPEPEKHIPNSASEIASTAVGATYLADWGYVGASVSALRSDYGVVAEEEVKVDMNQQRYDIAAELKSSGLFKAFRLKSAQSVYKHQEIESGVAGTTFKNNGNETRIELVQNDTGGRAGILGAQFNIFEFSALGDEAFLPVTDNSSVAVFAFQEWDKNPIKWNVGARAETNSIKPQSGGAFTRTEKESFTTGSLSAGTLYNITEHFSTGLNLSYNERAPNYQELFADGAHVATFSYQRGDPNLNKESAVAAEWSLRHQSKSMTGTVNIYGQRFKDFIALSPTGLFDDTDESGTVGDSADDLPIFQYLAQDADIYGVEIDTHFVLPAVLPGALSLQLKGDYVRGKNRVTGDNLPRLSPARASIGLLHKWQDLTSDIELQNVFEQTKVAPNETKTDGYLQTNLGLSYQIQRTQAQITVFGRVNNLFDVEARNHISFLKDVSQNGGRNFILGVRGYF